MVADADAIAGCVLSAFDCLPDKRKPRPRNDGTREWVPLSGIVLAKGTFPDRTSPTLSTGMKCLPSSKLPLARGNVLHDWHAEVLAIRAFNRFLLDECRLLSLPPYKPSLFIRRRSESEIAEAQNQPFALKDEVSIHMYCSEAPCGDASMELVMDAQEDSTPWTSPPPTVSPEQADADSTLAVLRGRSHFGLLGAVRLKPSRPDAPPTLSKSCSDKLALTQCTSLLFACTRAFGRSGRMGDIIPEMEVEWKKLGAGYGFYPFAIQTTDKEFQHSRRRVLATEKPAPSNLSAVYTPHVQETLIGGVLQGRKQFDARGASSLCRRSIWKAVWEIAGIVGVPLLVEAVRKSNYEAVKTVDLLEGRNMVKSEVKKDVLKGWVKNTGDEGFGLDSQK
ncbi:adenosine deaminase/editase [Clohesyomyces aquaticus]|uniref:Adenosine deaminase/editase n=1 Tax=Clohesyomyces aquaticus TaxID=1231657 RepID=A0A1Y1YWC5_9PLEO|nr:adenosine deaminase/editase [Clohesyomyces aquaticus]